MPTILDPHVPICSICNTPITLESIKTDGFGKVAHEECYPLDKTVSTATVIDFLKSVRTPHANDCCTECGSPYWIPGPHIFLRWTNLECSGVVLPCV
jgi:hypothetical protein